MIRRGMTLMEVVVAGVLLFALMATCVRYFVVTRMQERALDQRQAALQEAANVMERLMPRPFNELTPESVSHISLSRETQRILPRGELKIELRGEDAKPPAMRIMVTIRWQDQNNEWTRPVRLAAWRYQ